MYKPKKIYSRQKPILIDPETYVFTFGTWKDHTYQEVTKQEPSYIVWCAENIDWFDVPADELDKLYELDAEDLFPNLEWSDSFSYWK